MPRLLREKGGKIRRDMKPKTIEVDRDRLTEFIVDGCMNLVETVENTRWCRRRMDATCQVPIHVRDNCPCDCPHMNETASWRCDMEKCSYVKKTIKKLKA